AGRARGLRPTAAASGGVPEPGVPPAVERLAVALLRPLSNEPLYLGGELGSPLQGCGLIEHPHLERPVLRPRPGVPVAARAVLARRRLPVVPAPQHRRGCPRPRPPQDLPARDA